MRTMSEAESRDVIAGGRIGRLGCIANGEPYIVPINYLFSDESIFGHSLPGLKIEALRVQPRACFQVDEIRNDFAWRSVIAHGNFEEVRVPSERTSVLNRLLARFPLLTPVESALACDGGAPGIIVYRIRIDRLTGVTEG